MSQIDKVTLNVDIEMQLNGDELNVGFSTREGKRNDEPDAEQNLPSHSTLAQLEIVLKPQDAPEGLNILIEGYEKALRAQIPG